MIFNRQQTNVSEEMQEQSKRDRQGNLKTHGIKHREMAWQRVGKKYIYNALHL